MIFTRYLLKQYFKVFFMILISVLAIFLVLDFVGNIKNWLTQDKMNVFKYYLNYIPQIIYLIMPINMLLTTIVTVSGMSRHLEITAVKSAGRSVFRSLSVLLIVALFVTGAMYYLTENILPDANHKRLELAQPISKKKKTISRDKQKYNYLFIGAQGTTYYFDRYYSNSKLAKKVMLIFFEENQMIERVEARTMVYKDSSWVLRNGNRRIFKGDSIIYRPFKIYDLKDKIPEVPADFLDTRYSPDEMSSEYIRRKMDLLLRSGEDTKMLETQLYFKLAGCFVNFFVTLIAIALSHQLIRGGVSKNFGVGLLLAFSYYVIIKVGIVLGENGALSPIMGAWFGNIVFGVLGSILFIRSVRL